MEIAEDEEEENKSKRQSTVPEEITAAKAPAVTEAPPPLSSSPPPPSVDEVRALRSPESQARSPTKTIDEPRKSSQSTRPELYRYSSSGSTGKPKVKLGPRPSLDVGGRPHTSSATSHYRPVSTLPAGLKLFSKTTKAVKERPKSHYNVEATSLFISPPPIPDIPAHTTPVRPHTSGGRPSTSSGASIRSPVAISVNPPKSPTITPEKARLMKALQLRKKQMKPAAPSAEHLSPTSIEDPQSASVDQPPAAEGAPKDVHDTLAMLNDMAKEDDSGIAFDSSSAVKTEGSDATRSDSYPVSPVGPSERAESTKASSISESTDETVQGAENSIELAKVEHASDEPALEPPSQEPQEIPTKPVPTVEATIDELPRLLPVAYQPPVSPQVRSREVQEESRRMEEPAQTERPAAVEEAAPENHDAPEIAVGEVEPSVGDAPDTGVVTQLPTPEAPLEPENGLESPTPVNVVVEHVLRPKKSLTVMTEKAKALLPAMPSPLLKSPVDVEIKEWKVPRSKFSIPDLKAAAEAPASPTEPLPVRASLSPNAQSPVESTFSADTRRSMTEEEQKNNLSSRRMKRAGLIEPIRTDLEVTDMSHAGSEANFSSDDDLMEELQSAVVQEAKPVSVSKTPMSPEFPSPDRNQLGRYARSPSNPTLNDGRYSQLLSPLMSTPDSARSVSASATYFNAVNQQSSKPVVKKVNLGSGISQRIKALEKLSMVAPEATPPVASTGTSATFFSVRKGSVRSSKAPSIMDRTNSLTRNNTPSPPTSQHSSPEALKLHNRSESVQSRVDAFAANSTPPTLSHKLRPESISVTARIIRDPNQPFPAKSDVGKPPSEYTPLDLKQSPLVIDHQRAVTSPVRETFEERRSSTSSKASKSTTLKEKRSSINAMKDFIREGRASFSESRRSIAAEGMTALSHSKPPSAHANKSPSLGRSPSIGSRKSSRDFGRATSPPLSIGPSSPTGDETKKTNRASRILRRMSSSFSSSRKTLASVISPTVREESEPPSIDESQVVLSLASPVMSSINIGDVNVQFPDTLLWKRRSMLLDSQGFLVISPALSAKEQKNVGATRRMHLSEFRRPVIPDVEMQELPNSVVLDFKDGGSGLQVACEDRGGQARLLQGRFSCWLILLFRHNTNCFTVLEDAHSMWAARGQ